MKTYFLATVACLQLCFLSCQDGSILQPNDNQHITYRYCTGNWTHVELVKGKCKNECTKGISVRCGGYIASCRNGELQVAIPTCETAYSETAGFLEMSTLSVNDTSNTFKARIEFPDRYHARFVFLEDISEELEDDSEFTISNNVRWVDDDGFTFSSVTYHNFQFIGGDYPIVISTSYPFGTALVDMSTY